MSEHVQNRSDAILLDAVLGPLAESLRQVALPLHILLENRFGDLNDNQTEMIAAARDSAAAADILLRLAQRVRALEGRPTVARTETTRLLDLCRGALAIASGLEAHRGVRFDVDISPALTRVRGDRAHFEEALTLVLRDAASRASTDTAVAVSATELGPDRVVLRIVHGGGAAPLSLDRLLARRLIEGEGGVLVDAPASIQLTLLT